MGLLFRPLIRVALFLLFLQMPGTILPLFLLPEVCFTQIPFAPTLEGQYIIKNLILLSAAIAVGGTVRREESAHPRTAIFPPAQPDEGFRAPLREMMWTCSVRQIAVH